jgi:hypothetical protein
MPDGDQIRIRKEAEIILHISYKENIINSTAAVSAAGTLAAAESEQQGNNL